MKDKVYEEWRPEVVAQDEVNDIEIEIEALTTAVNLDVDLGTGDNWLEAH